MSAYDSPHLFASLDSLEGVPDIFEPRMVPAKRTGPQAAAHDALAWLGAVLPGVGLAALLAALGTTISDFLGTRLLGFKESPLSPIVVAVALGLLIRNTIGVPAAYEKGLRLCLKGVLRLGIVLLGLRLGLADAGDITTRGLPIIVVTIATALLTVTWLNNRLGLSRRLGALIAVGTSICGISAIVATGAAIDADEDEISYAAACITIFGLLGLFCYPFYSHWMFGPGHPQLAGLFMGSSIHDVSQTAGAGLMYQQQFGSHEALDVAVVVKLMRNVCMAFLIPLMAVLYHRNGTAAAQHATHQRQKLSQFVPAFILLFLAMVVLRSVGDHALTAPAAVAHWKGLIADANAGALWCLMLAMASVGLGTGLAKLRSIGIKPFCVGLAAAFLVAAVSTGLIKALAPVMHW
jgi:uncharacterized integral membrane protein (TIGR00698 family)